MHSSESDTQVFGGWKMPKELAKKLQGEQRTAYPAVIRSWSPWLMSRTIKNQILTRF